MALVLILSFFTLNCQSTGFASFPKSSMQANGLISSQAKEFESFSEDEDKVGQTVFVVLAVAVGVAAAILVPLAVNDAF